jgi:hypothetical protein
MKTQSSNLKISSIDQKIADLWQENMTAQEIGVLLNMTKNAVIGKVSRLRNKGYDLRKRESPKKVEPVAMRTEIPKPVIAWVSAPVIEPPPEPKKAHVSGPKSIMELGIDDCSYIINDGPVSSFLFCGEKKTNKTYCAAHHKLCYIRVTKKVKGKTFALKKLTYMSPYNLKDNFT